MYSHVKKTKLTQSEYFLVQDQYDRTPAPFDSTGATGEHYKLHMVLRNCGFHPTTKEDAYDLAGELLSRGYDFEPSPYSD